jgi:hypothetical protein
MHESAINKPGVIHFLSCFAKHTENNGREKASHLMRLLQRELSWLQTHATSQIGTTSAVGNNAPEPRGAAQFVACCLAAGQANPKTLHCKFD